MAMTTGAGEWFMRWLTIHKKLCPHKQWHLYEGDEQSKRLVYQGWVAAFDGRGITEEVATTASRNLQPRHPGYPEHHLEAVLAEAGAIMGRRATEADRANREAQRARAQAEVIEQQRRQAIWESMPIQARNCLRDRIVEETPALAQWPGMIHRLCLAAIDEQPAERRPARTRPNPRTIRGAQQIAG